MAACYDSLAQCLADAAVDVVYVACPHPFYFEVVEAALAASRLGGAAMARAITPLA